MKSIYYSHIVGLLVLFLYYFFSYSIFGKIIIAPHDNLDHGTVIDSVISKIFNGDFDAVSIFLGGSLKWYFLEEILFPINFLHLILEIKAFYFVEDVLKKIISYFCFYILARKITNNYFYSSISAVLYTSVTQMFIATSGLGLAVMPYLLYLMISVKHLKFKHYFLIFFLGLNISIVHDYLALILILPLAKIINESLNYKKSLQIISILSIGIILSNFPLFLVSALEETHRADFVRPNLIDNILISLNNLFNLFSSDFNLLFFLPYKVLIILIFLSFFISKNNTYKKLVIFLISLFFLKIILGSNIVGYLTDFIVFLKGFNFARIDKIFPLIICLLLLQLLKEINNKNLSVILTAIVLLSSIFIQIKTPKIELIKINLRENINEEKFEELKYHMREGEIINFIKEITNKSNYRDKFKFSLNSSNSFNGYYRFDDFNNLKKIINYEERIMSIGISPMIAAMNGIKVIDGYHTLYPKSYKKKFRKIIQNELEKNNMYKNYYDQWGNRLSIFFTNKNDIDINFLAARSIGAKYVLSTFKIKKKELISRCEPCYDSRNFYLYEIEE